MSIDTTVTSTFSSNGHKPAITHTVYVALGSNLGDRRGNLAAALQQLRAIMEITALSSLYETAPVGYLDQSLFLNMVCQGQTDQSPRELLKQAKAIETALGREATFRDGPRVIDIDLIFYDDIQIKQNDLIVPHPRMAERAFVLAPLAEIAPDMVEPISGHTVQELLRSVAQDGVKKIAADLRIPLDRDIQSSQPTVHVRLGKAGVVGIRKALLIGDKDHSQQFDATFDLYADLEPTQAGVHMSRFNESLEEVLEESAAELWPRIEVLAEHLARMVVQKQRVARAEVSIRTSLPLQKWTPVSGRQTQEIYGMLAQASATPDHSKRMIGVEVEGMVACPCAQDMVRSYTRLRLQEEGIADEIIEKMLAVTPLATHNQRGRATLLIGTQQAIDARDLVVLVENAMSSENYSLLKRPDELYLVNKAHSHPRFVEDVVREILRAVVELYTDLPDDAFIWVGERNEETIHKYDVEAEGWGTLGELRAEILYRQRLAQHTTREQWFGLPS
ncbi:MAG TPA: GTP cyclohydrolase MptA [Ktedonobacteraceae bacterium]|nr:GTP cyclohydrolase MptA [Ktedonobacteraceae bacterium]